MSQSSARTPLVGLAGVREAGQTSTAIGTNGYVSTWGALLSGCPRPLR